MAFALAAAAVWLLPGCLQSIAPGCGIDGFACCSGSTCEADLTCAPDGLCRPCGDDGQRCCDGRRCGLGAECGADDACHACGEEGQACCGASSCGGGLRCDNSTCVRPCGAACAPGELRCSASGGVDLCSYRSYPCTEWSAVIERCPQEQSCTAGVCGDLCPGACPLNSGLCTTEGLKICVYDPQTRCPVYQTAPSSSDLPSCLVGPCDESVCWESPLPFGGGYAGLTGSELGTLYLLDFQGNVVRGSDQTYTYDHRATSSLPRLNAIAECGLESALLGVGARGAAYRRSSSGWAVENVGDANVALYGIDCKFGRFSVAVGAGGKIFLRDGSGNWRTAASPTTSDLRAVVIRFAGEEAWAVGDDGVIVHCTDLEARNGPTQCVLEGAGVTSASLVDIALAGGTDARPEEELFAVGNNATVVRRSSAGVIGSWALAAPGLLARNLTAVYALGDGSVHIGGENGDFASRSAGGGNFEVLRFTSGDLVDLFALDATKLYAITSDGQLWFSPTNGASVPAPSESWRQIGGRQPTTAYLYDVAGLNADDVYAVGAGGSVLHKSGDVWRVEAAGLTTADLYSVTVVSAQEVYAVGATGVILAKRDGAWTLEGGGVTSNGLYATFHDGVTVYAVGGGGTWLEKPVGGASSLWHRVAQSVTSAILFAVSGQVPVGSATGATEVWAVGGSCTVLRKQNGSFGAVSLPGCAGDDLFGIWMGADGEVYVTGSQGLMLHRQLGTWTNEGRLTFENLYGVVGSGDTAYAVGELGELYQRSAGTWQPRATSLTSNGLRSVSITADGRMFVVGGGGLIWQGR